MESLERRVRQLDAQNKALTNSLHEARRQTSTEDTSNASNDSGVSNRVPLITSDDPYGPKESEVANEVSSLSLHAGGDRQFLGSASGMLLGKLLQVEVRTINQSRGDETPQTSTRPLATAHGEKGGVATPELSSLPPEKLARSLLLAYLSHDHLCYPFLHPRSLMEALDAIYDDETFYRNNTVEAFVFDMILAIGTAQVYKYDCMSHSHLTMRFQYTVTPMLIEFQGKCYQMLKRIMNEQCHGLSLYLVKVESWHYKLYCFCVSIEC